MNVPIIAKADSLVFSYDVLFCDVWGVIHDGVTAYEEAGHVLAKFRKRGGSVILISNAPLPSVAIAGVLAEKKVRHDAWDAIISSGDMALSHVSERRYRKIYRIGPSRDADLFRLLPGEPAELDAADAIICTGLVNEDIEIPTHYLPILHKALALKLPFVCANPDLVVDIAGKTYSCAGSIAKLYEEMGGAVHWAGKPFAQIYETALAKASLLRCETVRRARVLAIGDALRTDIEGARRIGIDSLFIAAGIHKREVMRDGAIVQEWLDNLFSKTSETPLAATDRLRGD